MKRFIALLFMVLPALPAIAATPLPASAGHLFRYRDANHKVHIDQQLSDDALTYGYDELDLNMNLLRTVPPRPSGKDLERLKAAEAQQAQAQAQAKQDALLRRMYSSPQDAARDRDSQVDAIQLRIDFTNSAIVRLRSLRAAEAERAASFERNGNPVPKEIQDGIAKYDTQIAAAEEDIRAHRVEQDGVRTQFAGIIKRLQAMANGAGAAASGNATPADATP